MRDAFAAALASAAFLSASFGADEARANGRYPASDAIFFSPTDHDTVLLRTTFGQLLSHDRGKTWDWICDESIGIQGVEDPMYALTPDGTIIGSTARGLAISHDQSCSYAFALPGLVMIDLTSRPSTPGTVIAFASMSDAVDGGASFFASRLFETTDEGKTFAPLGPSFDGTLLGRTVDVTASDPDRIYVSAVRDPGTAPKAFLLTSKDHAATFVENQIPLVSPERAAFIAAVDPMNAERIYLRTAAGVDTPSRLLLSDDAGKTFRTVFTAKGPLSGFALSKDGTKAWIGGPADGVRVASTTDFAFQQKSTIDVGCLAVAEDGLWACSTEQSGFVVGLSKDDGATFETKLHFCDIRGPLACAEGSTTNTKCAGGAWLSQSTLLGCRDPGTPNTLDGGTRPVVTTYAASGSGCSLRAPSATPFAASVIGVAAAFALRRRRSPKS